MRVGIDVTNLCGGLSNGTPILLFRLIPAMLKRDPNLRLVLLYNHTPGGVGDTLLDELRGPRAEVLYVDFSRHRVPRSGWWFPFHPGPRRLAGPVDLFHAGDFLRPARDGTPVVASVLDLTTRLHPETHTRKNRTRDALKLRWVRRAADRVLAISESTRRDVIEHLGFPSERVDVAPLARGHESGSIDPRNAGEVRSRLGIGAAPFVLCVGTLEPRKNQARLIRAFDRLAGERPNLRLVLAGGNGWEAEDVERALASVRFPSQIHRLGFVHAADLAVLYSEALIFAYPSIYEGFGLPLLEAMAAGAPVLTSNTSSMPEVAGDAAVLVDPFSVDEIHAALTRLVNDDALRLDLSARGRERERQFTWERCADATLSSYRRAIEAKRAAGGAGSPRSQP
jgi:glycosyltransferase involved in cell wall biosynthesis